MDIYQDLPELSADAIRLLRIEPAADSFPFVRCRLEVALLRGTPKFYALSYTWGIPYAEYEQHGENGTHQTTQTILCNGKEISVLSNLYDFLLHCSRSEDEELRGPVWIDAVCIHQSDTAERSHQVSTAGLDSSADPWCISIRVRPSWYFSGSNTARACDMVTHAPLTHT